MQKISLKNKNQKLSLKFKIPICIVIVLALSCVIGIITFRNSVHKYEVKVVAPTCENKGYTESVCVYCKKIIRKNYTSALGHDYGERVTESEPTAIEFGKETETCKRCNAQRVYNLEPTLNFKKFYYEGDSFSVNSDWTATGAMTYSYEGKTVKKYIKMKYINSNKERGIKNDFTVYFYDDKENTKEAKMALMDGTNSSSAWHFYGNFYDFYNLRNSVATELYRDVRSSSESVDSRLKDNYGTCKSEPVLMYFNQTFAGVFELVEPTTNETFNMDKNEKNQAIVRASSANNQTHFKTEISENSSFKVLYNSSRPEDKDKITETDDKWVYESLNELSELVREADDDEFKEKISEHLDVDGMIDYMLTIYNIGAADNVGRAFTLATYDGKIWTPSVYDLNLSFGLDNKGNITNLEKILAPEYDDKEEKYNPHVYSDLWDRMLNCYYDEIKERYYKLKDTVFSAENICEKFEKYKKIVPEAAYKAEAKLYKTINSDIDFENQITDFIKTRQEIFDNLFQEE